MLGSPSPIAVRLVPLLCALALCASAPAAGTERPAPLRFPDGFLWGTATSSYQVEGGIANNDWAAFEKRPGAIAHGDTCGAACEFRTRFREDLDRAKALGTTCFRLSIEWARVEPAEGVYDEAAIAWYRDLLDECAKRDLVPFVTLFHFCCPDWLAARGGWTAKDAPRAFERYAAKMAERLGDRIDFWTTQNETMGYLSLGYLGGVWAPGHKSPAKFWKALGNLIRGHGAAYRAIHRMDVADADGDGVRASVGVVHNFAILDPWNPKNPANRAIAKAAHTIMNRIFLDALSTGRTRADKIDLGRDKAGRRIRVPFLPAEPGTLDHLGINYYTRFLIKLSVKEPLVGVQQATRAAKTVRSGAVDPEGNPLPQNEMGWLIHPQGIRRAMNEVKRYGVPVYITENGIPDADGAERARYIADHLHQLHLAVAEDGCDVRGYIHWALMDNFEWAEGYWPRFGLYKVDYATQARTLTAGGAFFADACRANGLTAEMVDAVYGRDTTGDRDALEALERR